MKNIDPKLVSYIECEIFPIYETFDEGHDLNHIKAVIERALELGEGIDGVDMNIVYTASALHDIGIKVQRKNHAYYSGVFVREDGKLKEFFSNEEIEIIAQAVEDHSTSKGIEPRSIYGKIACDADKDLDINTSLLRAYEFTKKYFPDYSEEECINNVYEQLNFKFGKEGKVKFWIGARKQNEFLKQMKRLASDRTSFEKLIKTLIEEKNN